MTYATTDLSDAHPEAQVAEPIFGDFGGLIDFYGAIKTIKVFEDNALVRATLETPGEGRVLVVDGGGSNRCALVGGNLGQLGVDNGWAGIVVFGYVRDSEELAEQAIGIKALGTHPRKSEKGLHSAAQDKAVGFAGVTFKPGAWLYADADGIVVSDVPIHG
ncbi:MAG: ribonuclease E activity regulator RraA [Sinimarinibacterium flocculans]|uniref:4-hydroxy-4-methyl-2-oxoglutarate aldolase n=1 Tax=Sinimarinibacterium flocculans TaxID=985250 RepID=A0A318E9L4_9GAMM|nr:ribonuclease E activity regulator RraA [Sinimarinibacterium flocculans]PXV68605.1 regulator of ribonuclease activity A [Sinimarinibacterium flocculans]